MADQVQIGSQTIGVQDSNPLGGVLTGVNDGASWGLKNYQLQNQRDQTQAEMQKLRVQALKNQMDVGERLTKRMREISQLPLGETKNASINMLEEEMQGFGVPLNPAAKAYMKDKNFSQDLGSILDKIDSKDPEERVWAMAQLPYKLGSDEAVKYFQGLREEAGKDKRNLVTSIATATNAQAGRDATKANLQFTQGQENERQQNALAQQRQEKALERDQQVAIHRENLANDKFKTKEALVTEVGKETDALRKDFDDVFLGLNKLDVALEKKGGQWDNQILGVLDLIRSGKTSVLREGDFKQLSGAGGLFDKVDQMVAQAKIGDLLGPRARKDVKDIAKEFRAVYTNAYADALSRPLERVTNQGIKPSEAFDADQLRVLGASGALKGASSAVTRARAKEAAATKKAGPVTPPQTAAPGAPAPAAPQQKAKLEPAALKQMRDLILSNKATADQVISEYERRNPGKTLSDDQIKVLRGK